jgi:hypothetical protein
MDIAKAPLQLVAQMRGLFTTRVLVYPLTQYKKLGVDSPSKPSTLITLGRSSHENDQQGCDRGRVASRRAFGVQYG